jgi:hypothetical protein
MTKRFGDQAAQTDTQLKQAIMQLVQDPIERLQEGLVREGEEFAQVLADPGASGLLLRFGADAGAGCPERSFCSTAIPGLMEI